MIGGRAIPRFRKWLSESSAPVRSNGNCFWQLAHGNVKLEVSWT